MILAVSISFPIIKNKDVTIFYIYRSKYSHSRVRDPRFESWNAPFFGFGGEESGKILPYCSHGNRQLRMACARTDARSNGRVHQLLYTSFRSSTRSSSSAPCVYSEPRSTLGDLVKRSCCTFSWEMRAGRATRESCEPCEVYQLAHERIQREVDCSGGDDVKRVVRL